jgi:putative Mg2+ transporter-C (MgtC) family protein
LTTAASLWTVAAVGLAVGGGLYIAAISATVLILLILAGLKPLERWLFAERQAPQILLVVNRREMSLPAVESALASAELELKRTTIKQGKTPEEQRVYLMIKPHQQAHFRAAIEQLRTLPGVREISYAP